MRSLVSSMWLIWVQTWWLGVCLLFCFCHGLNANDVNCAALWSFLRYLFTLYLKREIFPRISACRVMVRSLVNLREVAEANTHFKQRVFLPSLVGKRSLSEVPYRCPLSLSFKLVHTSPVSVVLAVNVTQKCHVWCNAWTIGSPINVHELMKKSSGKYMQCSCFCELWFCSDGSLRHFRPKAVDDVCNYLYRKECFWNLLRCRANSAGNHHQTGYVPSDLGEPIGIHYLCRNRFESW